MIQNHPIKVFVFIVKNYRDLYNWTIFLKTIGDILKLYYVYQNILQDEFGQLPFRKTSFVLLAPVGRE